jgi:hypothetical protein
MTQYHNAVLLNITRSYGAGEDVYHATRRAWRIGERRDGVQYALAVCKGEVIEVFRVRGWHPDKREKSRWEFDGEVAPHNVRNEYRGRTYKMYGPLQYLTVATHHQK